MMFPMCPWSLCFNTEHAHGFCCHSKEYSVSLSEYITLNLQSAVSITQGFPLERHFSLPLMQACRRGRLWDVLSWNSSQLSSRLVNIQPVKYAAGWCGPIISFTSPPSLTVKHQAMLKGGGGKSALLSSWIIFVTVCFGFFHSTHTKVRLCVGCSLPFTSACVRETKSRLIDDTDALLFISPSETSCAREPTSPRLFTRAKDVNKWVHAEKRAESADKWLTFFFFAEVGL